GIGYEEILAGVELPAGPDEVARAIDEILTGASRGDVVIALLRAAAFVGLCAERTGAADPRTRLRQLPPHLSDDAVAHRRGGLRGERDRRRLAPAAAGQAFSRGRTRAAARCQAPAQPTHSVRDCEIFNGGRAASAVDSWA